MVNQEQGMKKRLRSSTTRLLALGFIFGSSSAIAMTLAPKTGIRTGGTLISNSVSGRSTTSIGGFEILGHVFLSPKIAAGLGYKADFDLGAQVVPLKGFEIQGRYYFLGSGTRLSSVGSRFERTSRSLWNAYASGTLYVAKYFVNVVNNPLEGDANLILGGIGIEYALSQNFELVAELQTSILSFSSDPETVRFVTRALSFGVSYLH